MGKTTNITITAASRKKKPVPKQKDEKRHGPFSRIDDDPLPPPDNPPVLLINVRDESYTFSAKTYDISTPALPKKIKAATPIMYSFTARVPSVGFTDPLGVAVIPSNLAALNISKPRAITVSSLTTAGVGAQVIEGGVLYSADGGSGSFGVADVSDPSSIAILGQYAFNYTAFPVGFWQVNPGKPAVLSKRMYVANFDFGAVTGSGGFPADNNNYLATYNFDDPLAPTQVNTVLLEDITTAANELMAAFGVIAYYPPTELGVGVIYVGYTFRDSPTGDYSTKLLTFSIASPDAPAQVNSITLNTGIRTVVKPIDKLFTNKSKTRLMVLTHNPRFDSDLFGELKMYDILTDPEAPALLDSITVLYPDDTSRTKTLYVTDAGYVYLSAHDPVPAIEVYDIRDDVFALLNTVAVPSAGESSVMFALDAKGFPQ